MHINKVSQTDIAKKMGVTNDYVWMILNGKKSPKNAETRIKSAIADIIREREKNE
nr:MAG TPA: DNA-binding protein [Caudoviricetes sp.]